MVHLTQMQILWLRTRNGLHILCHCERFQNKRHKIISNTDPPGFEPRIILRYVEDIHLEWNLYSKLSQDHLTGTANRAQVPIPQKDLRGPQWGLFMSIYLTQIILLVILVRHEIMKNLQLFFSRYNWNIPLFL